MPSRLRLPRHGNFSIARDPKAQLVRRAEKSDLTAQQLDALIAIAETHGGKAALIRDRFKESRNRALRVQAIVSLMRRHHNELHAMLDPSTLPCAPGISVAHGSGSMRRLRLTKCRSREGALNTHAGAIEQLMGVAQRATVHPRESLAFRRLCDSLPRRCRDLGSVVAFLHEELEFKHPEIAVLRLSARGVRATPEQIEREAAAVRKAYQAHRAARR